MIVTHEIEMDLIRRREAPLIEVVQNDRYSRNLAVRLLRGGAPWRPGPGVSAMVRYVKPDGTGGSYNFLPDETPAWRVERNVVTVALAPQVCTAAGRVKLVVALVKDAATLHTFLIELDVQSNPGLQVTSEDYYRVSGTLPDFGWEPGMLLGTDDAGDVVAVAPVQIDETLTCPGAAADAEAVGGRLGALSELETQDRSSLVAAVNEVAELAEAGIRTINGVGPDEAGNLSMTIRTLPSPASARVGQYLRVTAVDKNGAVTAMEAVTLDAGVVTAYDHNGVKYPTLPHYDPEEFPFAMLSAPDEVMPGSGVWGSYLYLCPSVAHGQTAAGWGLSYPAETKVCYISSKTQDDFSASEWGSFYAGDGYKAAAFFGWANFDILNEDGTVYLAASEPVPVTADGGSGSGLKTVELTTCIPVDTTGETELTEAEGALLDAAAAAGDPIILSFPAEEGSRVKAVFNVHLTSGDGPILTSMVDFYLIGAMQAEGLWFITVASPFTG